MTEKPRTINILGLDYKVEHVDVIDKDVRTIGQIDYLNQIIKLEKGLSPQKEKVTLIHEILHGILHQLGFDEQHDEKLIEALATGIYQVFSSNREEVRIMSKEKMVPVSGKATAPTRQLLSDDVSSIDIYLKGRWIASIHKKGIIESEPDLLVKVNDRNC